MRLRSTPHQEVIDLIIKKKSGSIYWGYAIFNGKTWMWDRNGEQVYTLTFNALIKSLRSRDYVKDVVIQHL